MIYNTLPADDGWFPLLNLKLLANFWTRENRLYWIADGVEKIFELFSDGVRRSLIFERWYDPNDVSLRQGVVLLTLIFRGIILFQIISLAFSWTRDAFTLIACKENYLMDSKAS